MLYTYNEIKTLHLEVTERCNASCPMCSRNINGGEENPWLHDAELSLSDIKKIIPVEFIQQLSHMYMCGNFGDPIAAKDTLSIFEYFRKYNDQIVLSMNTNGSARPKKWWENLANILGTQGYIIFSIDGLADTNHLYRKNTDWNRIVDNATAFIEAGGIAHWEFIVFAHNEHQIEEAREVSAKLGFAKFQVKKSARFLSNSGSAKEKIINLDKKLQKRILSPPKNIEYRNLAVEKIATDEDKNTCYPTTQKDLLTYVKPEMFSNVDLKKTRLERQLDTAVIQCKVQKEKSIFVTAEGILQPCCWVAGQMYNWQHTPKGSQIWKLINQVGKSNLSLFNHPIKDVVNGLYFSKLISDSWSKSSCYDGKLQICAKICGKETDVFSQQYI